MLEIFIQHIIGQWMLGARPQTFTDNNGKITITGLMIRTILWFITKDSKLEVEICLSWGIDLVRILPRGVYGFWVVQGIRWIFLSGCPRLWGDNINGIKVVVLVSVSLLLGSWNIIGRPDISVFKGLGSQFMF